MNDNIKKILNQLFSFFLVSGVGWIIDFTIYILITHFSKIEIFYANIISAIPAITYVFWISNKKIFNKKDSKFNLTQKYGIYFVYQLMLLLFVSFVGQLLYNGFMNSDISNVRFLNDNIKIIIKIFITPITMTLNFIVMKNLIEKL